MTFSIRRVFGDRFIRFLIFGGINTALCYGLYALLLFFGLKFQVANLFALIGGLVLSFKLQSTFVFGIKDNRLVVRFVVAWLIIYMANVLLIGWLVGLGLSAYMAGALGIGPIAIISFLIQKYLVFKASPARTTIRL